MIKIRDIFVFLLIIFVVIFVGIIIYHTVIRPGKFHSQPRSKEILIAPFNPQDERKRLTGNPDISPHQESLPSSQDKTTQGKDAEEAEYEKIIKKSKEEYRRFMQQSKDSIDYRNR